MDDIDFTINRLDNNYENTLAFFISGEKNVSLTDAILNFRKENQSDFRNFVSVNKVAFDKIKPLIYFKSNKKHKEVRKLEKTFYVYLFLAKTVLEAPDGKTLIKKNLKAAFAFSRKIINPHTSGIKNTLNNLEDLFLEEKKVQTVVEPPPVLNPTVSATISDLTVNSVSKLLKQHASDKALLEYIKKSIQSGGAEQNLQNLLVGYFNNIDIKYDKISNTITASLQQKYKQYESKYNKNLCKKNQKYVFAEGNLVDSEGEGKIVRDSSISSDGRLEGEIVRDGSISSDGLSVTSGDDTSGSRSSTGQVAYSSATNSNTAIGRSIVNARPNSTESSSNGVKFQITEIDVSGDIDTETTIQVPEIDICADVLEPVEKDNLYARIQQLRKTGKETSSILSRAIEEAEKLDENKRSIRKLNRAMLVYNALLEKASTLLNTKTNKKLVEGKLIKIIKERANPLQIALNIVRSFKLPTFKQTLKQLSKVAESEAKIARQAEAAARQAEAAAGAIEASREEAAAARQAEAAAASREEAAAARQAEAAARETAARAREASAREAAPREARARTIARGSQVTPRNLGEEPPVLPHNLLEQDDALRATADEARKRILDQKLSVGGGKNNKILPIISTLNRFRFYNEHISELKQLSGNTFPYNFKKEHIGNDYFLYVVDPANKKLIYYSVDKSKKI